MKKYSVGIDLGTTNCVVAYRNLEESDGEVKLLPIPQVVSPSTIEQRNALPSFTYLSSDEERQNQSYALPWTNDSDFALGEWARRQSAEIPTRAIAAAKSWLCHGRVDRRSDILPWNAPDDVQKISPMEASGRYLAHLASAWNHAFPDAPISEQQVVLTVPASFDASARELTREAALAAGLPEEMILIEEPQAAVYSWLSEQGERWRDSLQRGDRVLVCDIGGGTTDFTLISVDEEGGELVLNRQAVGNHILVGGDNMDLTLAHVASEAFREKGIEVNAWQAVGLWHSCREVKEKLLKADGPDTCPVAVLGRGSSVIGGTVSVEIDRANAASVLLEGFFPVCELDARPARSGAPGFKEVGLPFESEAAITKHLAHFISTHAGGEKPSHILFNGGVMKSEALAFRMDQVFSHWFGAEGKPVPLKGSRDLDFAVARGAAYYGAAKISGGVRIRGGAGQSYYVGIESSGLAVPGIARPFNALCVVPFGMEEGTEAAVDAGGIGVVVGEPAQFRFFRSSVRKNDQSGDLLSSWSEEDLVETAPMEAEFPRSESREDDFVPIRFRSKITELGTFELWSESTVSEDRWKLEFSVRD